MKPSSYMLGTITGFVCAAVIAETSSVYGHYYVCLDDMSMKPGHDQEFTAVFDSVIPGALKAFGVCRGVERHQKSGAPGGGLTLADTIVSALARHFSEEPTNPGSHPLLATGSIKVQDLTPHTLTNIRTWQG